MKQEKNKEKDAIMDHGIATIRNRFENHFKKVNKESESKQALNNNPIFKRMQTAIKE